MCYMTSIGSVEYWLTRVRILANNFNGDNLLECDQAVLKELGIKKIGDRVRVFLAIKSLRTHAYSRQKKRNRVCHPEPHARARTRN